MLITVLVPIYNTSKYLKSCIDSIIGQTYTDLEILCLNDGSTDGSAQIVAEYAQTDTRIRLINKENTGYGNTMNIGIREAKGQYIGIVESDDYVELDMYEKLLCVLEKEKADFVKSAYYEVSGDQKRYKDLYGLFPHNAFFYPMDYPQVFGLHPSVWSGLYNAEFLKKNDIFFLESPGASFQDVDFMFKCYANADKVCIWEEAFVNYRIDNMSSSIHEEGKLFCVFDEMQEIYSYISKHFAKEKREKLAKIADWIAFREYDWNFERLSFLYRYTVLEKAAEQLKGIDHHNLDRLFWSDAEVKRLYTYIDDIEREKMFKRRNYAYSTQAYRNPALINNEFSIVGFLNAIQSFTNIRIYGAGIMGRKCLKCIIRENKGEKVQSFVVTAPGGEKVVDGIEVVCIEELEKESLNNDLFIVAVRDDWQYDIIDLLSAKKCRHVLYIDEQIKKYMNTNC